MIENWHSHTTISDGKMDYESSLRLAEKLGVGVVAFTDHDSLPNDKEIKKLLEIRTRTKWVMGLEISATNIQEMGDKQMSLFHVLGLFVDPTNKALNDCCKKSQAGRRERMERVVKNLVRLGFEITAEECLEASGGETIGRPHIVSALKKKASYFKIIGALKEEMRLKAEKDELLRERYQKMIDSGEDHYPYFLFLTDEAFIKGVFVNYLNQIDLDGAVKLIRGAGGVAILAHYYSVQKKISPDLLAKLIESKRIDGLETVCGLFAYGGPMEKEVRESRIITQNVVDKYKCIATGGMDSHSVEDWNQYKETDWFSKETVGMMKEILKHDEVKPTKNNCNFLKK